MHENPGEQSRHSASSNKPEANDKINAFRPMNSRSRRRLRKFDQKRGERRSNLRISFLEVVSMEELFLFLKDAGLIFLMSATYQPKFENGV